MEEMIGQRGCHSCRSWASVQLWWSAVVVNQGLPLCIGQATSALNFFQCISYFLLNFGGGVALQLSVAGIHQYVDHLLVVILFVGDILARVEIL